MKREIIVAVRGEKGKVFKPGMEKELADTFDQETLNRLVNEGVLVGDWKSFKNEENFLSQEETFARFEQGDESDEVMESLKYWNRKRVTDRDEFLKEQKFGNNTEEAKAEVGKEDEDKKSKSKSTAKTTSKADDKKAKGAAADKTDGLPEDFPEKAKLTELGLKSVAEVQALTADQLKEIGLDEKTVEAVLAYGK